MTTPVLSIEERVTVLETRYDTILPTLATKADIAVVATEITRLEGRMDTMNERMDAMGNRLLIKFGGIAITVAALAVAASKYL